MTAKLKQQINELAQKGQHKEVYQLLKQAIEQDNFDEAILYQASVYAFRLMNYEDAITYMEKLLKQTNDDPRYVAGAVDLFLHAGLGKRAIELQNKLEISGSPEQMYKLAMLHYRIFDFESAKTVFEQLSKLAPNSAQVEGMLADMSHGKGDFSDAINKYQQILSYEPTNEAALYGLVKSTKFKQVDNAVIESANAILDNTTITKGAKSQVHYSLAKMYDDCGDTDNAWSHYTQANKLQAEVEPHDAAELEKQIELIKKVFTPELQSKFADSGQKQASPIFIVGMPRSGTTLLEQVLENTGVICGAGESLAFNKGLNRRFFDIEYPAQIDKAPPEMFELMGQDYLDFIANNHVKGDLRTVDKLPGNFLNLGTLKLMFPNMKVINLVRNKMDNALSIFFQYFSNSMTFTTDFNHILHYREIYESTMAHWREQFPENIYDLHYEDFVGDFDNQTRALFEFLELEWTDQVKDFVNSKNVVTTPSSWQVRQGINKNAIGRFEKYREKVEAVLDKQQLTDNKPLI